MPDFAGFPFCEVRFDKDGKVKDPAQANDVLAMIDTGLTDLIVISHGWNNDDDDARGLYERFARSARNVLDAGHLAPLTSRRIGFLRVFWPSKKFADDDDSEGATGRAASIGSPLDAEIDKQFEALKALLANPEASAALDGLQARIGELDDNPDLQDEFVDTLRRHMSGSEANADDASDRFFRQPGRDLLEDLSKPVGAAVRRRAGGAAAISGSAGAAPPRALRGGAALFSLGGIKSAVNKLLNMSTYYEMKSLAGTVGREGVCPLLRQVRARAPDLRLHLVGHSFGGRLVTSVALTATNAPPLSISSMSLLQAAFSHHGFAKDFDRDRDGFFRNVVEKQAVSGPVLITHTVNDRAVGRLYPLASQLVGEDAAAIELLNEALAAIGGPAKRFGGIGRNGAQKTPEAITGTLNAVGAPYTLTAGKLHNLEASKFIANHSDVSGEEVAHAVLAAIAVT